MDEKIVAENHDKGSVLAGRVPATPLQVSYGLTVGNKFGRHCTVVLDRHFALFGRRCAYSIIRLALDCIRQAFYGTAVFGGRCPVPVFGRRCTAIGRRHDPAAKMMKMKIWVGAVPYSACVAPLFGFFFTGLLLCSAGLLYCIEWCCDVTLVRIESIECHEE